MAMGATGFQMLWGKAAVRRPDGVFLSPKQEFTLAELHFDTPVSLGWSYRGPNNLDLTVETGCGTMRQSFTRLALDGCSGMSFGDNFRLIVKNQTGLDVTEAIYGSAAIVTSPLQIAAPPFQTTTALSAILPPRWRKWVNIYNPGPAALDVAVGRPPLPYAQIPAKANLRIDDFADLVDALGPCTCTEQP